MPTTYDFPASIMQGDVTLTLQGSVSVAESPFSYKRYVQDWGGERWEISIDFISRKMEHVGPLEAFLLKIRHGRNFFRVGDPYKSLPNGTASGTPVLDGAATAGNNTITTRGWSILTVSQLTAGDLIQIEDSLYKVLDNVDSDLSGEATITVAPRVRKNHADGTTIKTSNPVGVFATKAEPTITRRSVTSGRATPDSLVGYEVC